MMLVFARKELFDHTLEFMHRINSRLSSVVADSPTAPLRHSTIADTINTNAAQETTDGAELYVDKYTQTDDQIDISSSSSEARLLSVVEQDAEGQTPTANDSSDIGGDMLPLSYHSLQYVSRHVKLLPDLLTTPGQAGASYSINELNLLIDQFSYAGVNKHRTRPEISSMAQTKQFVSHLKDEIRDLKSITLTMN